MHTASEKAPAAKLSVRGGADRRVRARREELGLRRSELAELVGLGTETIANIETRRSRPSLEVAERIAGVLDAAVDELFDLVECDCGCGELVVDQARNGSTSRFASGHNCRQPEHGSYVTRGHQERRRRLGIAEEKVCERCGEKFTRSDWPRLSDKSWSARRYCDGDCRWPIRVQERPCDYCGKLYRPNDNAPTRRFCCRRHGQLNRWRQLVRDGQQLVADEFIRQMRGKNRHHFGRLSVKKRSTTRRSYTNEQAEWVRQLGGQGYGHDRIADITGLHRDTVRRIRRPEKRS